MRINDILNEIENIIDQHVLEDYIARGWVRPVCDETDYIFDDMDIARIRLVCELHLDMSFDIDAIDIILSLMDQLHESNCKINQLIEIIEKNK